MSFDFTSLGIANDAEEQAEEQEEQAENEQEEPREEQPAPTPQQEPKKPKVDHSVPPRKRIEEERSKLKFEATILGSMNRQAAKIVGDLILWEFDHFPEREQEWDYNEWTLVDFLQKFSDEARKQVNGNGNQALFAGRTEDESDPTMELVRSIIHTKNEPPKPPVTPKKPEAKPKPTPKAEKPEPKAKEEPKKDHEQLKLNFSALFD